MELYRRDQARLPKAFQSAIHAPSAVVQPVTPQGVANVLSWCQTNGVAAVPRGAGSNAFGGSLATGSGQVVVDLRRLDEVIDVDPDSNTAWVEAGATWNRIEHYLARRGKALRVQTTSRFSTVGGMVATGGMGLGSTKWGSIQDNVVELEVATPDGLQILSAAEAAHLFRTDGQLGIITAVRIHIRDAPQWARTVVTQYDDYQAAINAARDLTGMAGIQNVLVYDAHRIHEVNAVVGRNVIPERDTVVARFEADTEVHTPASDVDDVAVGVLWEQRHFPMRPLKLGPGLLGAEVTLPDAAVGDFVAWGRKALAPFHLHAANEAYVLPNGQVLNITTFLTDAAGSAYTAHVAQVARLTQRAVKMGGKPYGGGIWNIPFAKERHDDLTALRSRKATTDPSGIINPGKSLDPPPRSSRLGAALRSPAATMGPGALRIVARANRFEPRRTVPERVDVIHPGASGTTPLHQGPGDDDDAPGPGHVAAQAYSHDACTQCAACVPVCPAWQHTGDDRTTARGKLQFMADLARDATAVTAEDAASLYQCIRCRACEEVCQTDLPLLAAFDDLEAELTERFGFPRDRIVAFLEGVEADVKAQAVIDETRGVFDQPHFATVAGRIA